MNRIFFMSMIAVTVGSFTACTQDNVHAPEREIITVDKPAVNEEFDDSLYYEGTLTSSVPSMSALMDPVSTTDFMQFKNMTDKTSGYATLVLGGFDITVKAIGMTIKIGDMEIDSVQYAYYPNGNGMFFKEKFEAMAGRYNTVGTLHGTFDASGKVTLTMDYKPGSMPFECHSELEATRK